MQIGDVLVYGFCVSAQEAYLWLGEVFWMINWYFIESLHKTCVWVIYGILDELRSQLFDFFIFLVSYQRSNNTGIQLVVH